MDRSTKDEINNNFNTTPGMNAQIVALLESSNSDIKRYAAKRIKELEAFVRAVEESYGDGRSDREILNHIEGLINSLGG